MILPYRDCALFSLQIPIYWAVKVGRVRARKITTQGACELGAVVLSAADSNRTIASGNRTIAHYCPPNSNLLVN